MQNFRVLVLGGAMVTACSTLLCLALEILQLATSPFNFIAFSNGKTTNNRNLCCIVSV